MGMKVNFAAVFTDITRKGALPEVSIHIAKMTAIKGDSQKRRQKMGNICRPSELYGVY